MQKPRLSEIAKSQLAALRNDGIEPTDEEIVWLYLLGKQATEGASDSRLLLYTGVRAGNTTFYPFSIGARLVLSDPDGMGGWFRHDNHMQEYAALYASAHSREPEKLTFKTARQARRTIKRWLRGVNATNAELRSAFAAIGDQEQVGLSDPAALLRDVVLQAKAGSVNMDRANAWYEAQEKPARGDLPAAVSLLLMYAGQTPDFWIWKCSEAFADAVLNKALAHERRKLGGADDDDRNDPALKAYTTGLSVLTEIRRRHG